MIARRMSLDHLGVMKINNTTMLEFDSYDEVVNGANTYNTIVETLKSDGSILIGWTDEASSHFDILFTLRPSSVGNIQGGIKSRGDLFVSIMRVGAFAFEINKRVTADSYYMEKLHMNSTITGKKLATLINKVKAKL